MTEQTVFYSWQSDLPNSTNRSFIQDCLERAIKEIRADGDVRLDPSLDRDTQGRPGSPDITDTIFDKIDQCAAFVCDLSFINGQSIKADAGQYGPENIGRLTPNPNVMGEWGRASTSVGFDRIICVFNSATGDVERLPFDLRKRRVISYSLVEGQEKAGERKRLVRALKDGLKDILEVHRAVVDRRLADSAECDEKWGDELHRVRESLEAKSSDVLRQGSWSMMFRPAAFIPDRWQDSEHLEHLLLSHAVRSPDQFPPSFMNTHARNWGISAIYRGAWGLTRSGMFVYRLPFWENRRAFDSPYIQYADGMPSEQTSDIAAGKWIDYKTNLFLQINFFMFMTRFVEAYGPEEAVVYGIQAGPIAGRILASTEANWHIENSDPCYEQEFSWQKAMPVSVLQEEWTDRCAEAMKGFFDLFPARFGDRIQLDTYRKLIDRYENGNLH